MKLIDKAALLAEIERLVNNYDKALDYEAALEDVRNFLDTIEVKESNFKDIKSVFEGQYVSKDKVVTTIERLQDECEEQGDNNGVELLEKLFNKLDTIEVKEVDLEDYNKVKKVLSLSFMQFLDSYRQEGKMCLSNGECFDIDKAFDELDLPNYLDIWKSILKHRKGNSMTDKEKFRQEVEKLKSNLMYGACSSQIAMETTCKEEAYNEVLAILDTMQEEQEEPAIDELEKVVEEIVDPTVLNAYGVKEIANRLRKTMIEPVSEDLEEAANDAVISLVPSFGQKYSDGSYVSCIRDSFKREELIKLYKAGAKWQKAKDESTTEDLGEYINELSKQFPEVSFAKLSRIAVRVAKWQKEHLWKPADGEDLPEYDREVIVLTQPYPLKDSEYAVFFAHRPDPKGWDGKSITTGKIEHYTPKTYGKSGWNAPNIAYWLDIELPKEIEL